MVPLNGKVHPASISSMGLNFTVLDFTQFFAFQAIVAAVGDQFYKITSEALLVTQHLVKAMRPLGKIRHFQSFGDHCGICYNLLMSVHLV